MTNVTKIAKGVDEASGLIGLIDRIGKMISNTVEAEKMLMNV